MARDDWPGYVRAGRQRHDTSTPPAIRRGIETTNRILAKAQAMTDITGIVGTDNEDDLPENEGYGTVDPGEYNFIVQDEEVRETNDGTGYYLQIECEISAPAYQGRKVFENLTLKNSNDTAQEIGRRQLRALAEACGVTGYLQDTSKFVGQQFQGTVTVETWEGDDGVERESNGIDGFRAATADPSGPEDTTPGRTGDSGPSTSKKDLDEAAPF